MATIRLPDLPKGKEFEEFLAAYFQVHGLYVERNIIDRQEEDVLEFDAITTAYESKTAPPVNKLLEMKSGDWGFGDIFKIRGWLDYANIPSGALLVHKTRPSIDFYQEISKGLDISIVTIDDLTKAADCLAEMVAPDRMDQKDIVNWRFSYWVERNLQRLLTNKKKSVHGRKCYAAMDQYLSLVNNRIFLQET